MKTENIKLFPFNSKNFKQINTEISIKNSLNTIPPRNRIKNVFTGFLSPNFIDNTPRLKLTVVIIPAIRNA